MKPEIEAKFLDADHDALRVRLKEIGAECVASLRLMKRKNYDFADGRLSAISGWVRLRDEGGKVTLSYKQMNDRTLHGTHEVSVVVADFAQTDAFLQAIGLQAKSYQETRRESWRLGEFEIELDEWPWIRPFMEMEGPGEVSLQNLAAKLGLDWAVAVHGSVEIAYMAEYNVTEQEVDEWPEITFTPVPDWLEVKRRS